LAQEIGGRMSARGGPNRPLARTTAVMFDGRANRRTTTMRFMMLMIPGGYDTAAPDVRPEADAVEAMMAFNKKLKDAGVLISLDGLHPPASGARVTYKGGKPLVTDGPFGETKEVLGGYWIIDVNSRDEAIEWARQVHGGENETVEVRQIFEMSDFPDDVQAKVAEAGF
jgi:hypothetical protein